MTRRWLGAVVLVLVAAACNGDDDDAVETSAPETSAVTTEPPVTTESSPAPETTESTTSTTAEATTTTVDVEALKAQIEADYLKSEQALEDLSRNPTLDDLEGRVAAIAVPGSESYNNILAAIGDDVAQGRRVIPGDPDYSDAFVEQVELPSGPDGSAARVTVCIVTNQIVVGPDGTPVDDDAGSTLAARVRQDLQRTSAGWLRTSARERVEIERGLTSCSF